MRFITREKSGVGPEKGDEPAEEDNLPAVAQKQILAHLEPRLIESDVSAVSGDQADPDRTTDQVADVVAYDGGRGRDEHDQSDTDLVRRSGVESGRHQGCLARHWNTHAFQRDQREQDPKAIRLNQVLDPGR
jgi:hypothetical protein